MLSHFSLLQQENVALCMSVILSGEELPGHHPYLGLFYLFSKSMAKPESVMLVYSEKVGIPQRTEL